MLFFFCAKIQFRLNWCNFSIGNGSTDRTPEVVHRFSAKIQSFGLRTAFFWKFLFRWSFFFAPEFSLRQTSATFRLDICQRERLPWRIIVFQPNSIVLDFEMAYFKNFRSGAQFFIGPKFSFAYIGATFRLEIGQWEGLPWRIIIFRPNSIVSVYEMAFFKNFRLGALFFFVPEFSFT